jgi:pimeloyl-ACP methyl ester carboxylesterase
MTHIAPAFSYLPKFKKPVPMKPPLIDWDPVYLRRKAELPEKIFKLKSGKRLAYFTEGELNNLNKVVVCFPGAGFGKSCFTPREPIDGVYLICIDDMGHGNSSQIDKPVDFGESVAEVMELLDSLLGDKNFYVCGHSRGGVHAMQVAAHCSRQAKNLDAQTTNRVLGCAVISSPCDLWHPKLSKEERKKLDPGSAYLINQRGWRGGFVRRMLKGLYYYPDKTKDFGFKRHKAGGYAYYKGSETGGAPKCMESDHFFISRFLDGELHGANSEWALLLEFKGLFSHDGWFYDVGEITCPCFLYNETDSKKGEVPFVMMERNRDQISQAGGKAELVIWNDHGHCSILMEFENIVHNLIRSKAASSKYCD